MEQGDEGQVEGALRAVPKAVIALRIEDRKWQMADERGILDWRFEISQFWAGEEIMIKTRGCR